jgi:hypothetical protein
LTALEEIAALAQNYAVTLVQILPRPRGVAILLHTEGGGRPIEGHGATVEDAAATTLISWRRKCGPKDEVPPRGFVKDKS